MKKSFFPPDRNLSKLLLSRRERAGVRVKLHESALFHHTLGNVLMGVIIIIVCITASISGCNNKYADFRDKIRKGQSKQALLKLFGDPYEKKIVIKSQRFIWGPEEDFWDKIPMATRLERWSYNISDGHLNLYFLEEGGTLDYIAFAPKGVVY